MMARGDGDGGGADEDGGKVVMEVVWRSGWIVANLFTMCDVKDIQVIAKLLTSTPITRPTRRLVICIPSSPLSVQSNVPSFYQPTPSTPPSPSIHHPHLYIRPSITPATPVAIAAQSADAG